MTTDLHAEAEEVEIMESNTTAGTPWVIVLSGGEGRRMGPRVQKWLQEQARPKQYCAFVGTRTMYEHTLDRMSRITSPDRMISVIGRGHGAFISRPEPGQVVEQPADRGTGAGVLLPAAHVLESDPEATVVVTPSDHFVHPETMFLHHVTLACSLAERHPDHVILLGVRPCSSETDYGWIEPEPAGPYPATSSALRVRSFHEKPEEAAADRLLASGALWNTFVLVTKVRTLWSLGCQYIPGVTARLDILRQVLHAVRHGRGVKEHVDLALEHVYRTMPNADFSREILQNVADRILVVPIENTRWSDWGRPERIVTSLAALGKYPAFFSRRNDPCKPTPTLERSGPARLDPRLGAVQLQVGLGRGVPELESPSVPSPQAFSAPTRYQ